MAFSEIAYTDVEDNEDVFIAAMADVADLPEDQVEVDLYSYDRRRGRRLGDAEDGAADRRRLTDTVYASFTLNLWDDSEISNTQSSLSGVGADDIIGAINDAASDYGVEDAFDSISVDSFSVVGGTVFSDDWSYDDYNYGSSECRAYSDGAAAEEDVEVNEVRDGVVDLRRRQAGDVERRAEGRLGRHRVVSHAAAGRALAGVRDVVAHVAGVLDVVANVPMVEDRSASAASERTEKEEGGHVRRDGLLRSFGPCSRRAASKAAKTARSPRDFAVPTRPTSQPRLVSGSPTRARRRVPQHRHHPTAAIDRDAHSFIPRGTHVRAPLTHHSTAQA